MAQQGASRLIAVVTDRQDGVLAGGLPVFVQPDADKRRQLAVTLSQIVRGTVHQLEEGTYVIVRH